MENKIYHTSVNIRVLHRVYAAFDVFSFLTYRQKLETIEIDFIQCHAEYFVSNM